MLRCLLRPHFRKSESARGFEASYAVTGCFLLRAVFVEAVKNEEDWRTRDEVRYSNLPPGGVIEGVAVSWKVSTVTWKASAVSWKVRRGLAVSTVSRCDGAIEGFDGAIEGATVSYRLCHRSCDGACHRRCDGAWRFRRCHRRFDGACRFRRCHRRCGGVIEGFDGVIEASSGVRVPPQVRAGSRKVRTDLARKFATAASIDQILFSIVVVSVSSRVCCFLFMSWLWRFRVSSAWCLASRRVGFLEEY